MSSIGSSFGHATDGTMSGIGFCGTLARDEEVVVGILGGVGEEVKEPSTKNRSHKNRLSWYTTKM